VQRHLVRRRLGAVAFGGFGNSGDLAQIRRGGDDFLVVDLNPGIT
jgi:hypothetical protein